MAMSHREASRLCCGIQGFLPLFELPAQVGVSNGADLYEVHLTGEEGLEVLEKPEVHFRVLTWAHGRELHGKVQIALFGIEVISKHRA